MVSPDLNFTIESANTLRFAASPHIVFKLHVTNESKQAIHTVILRCQIHIDVSQRRYAAQEQERLADLFGEPERWGQTMRSLLWTNVNVVVPSFKESVIVEVPVPCTFDFNVAATKYFAAIGDGDFPVSCFFNGTIFYERDDGALQAVQIPWEKEAAYRMPVGIWRDMMNAYYPNSVWLCLERNAFNQLQAYKVKHGIPTFEQAILHAIDALAETKTR
jgi:uncharacterized protein DUF6084